MGPVEQKWQKERQKLQEQYGSLQQQTHKLLESGNEFVDECEVLEYGAYEPPPTKQQLESGHDAKNHKYIKQSSHEKVHLAADGKTPLYMDEGHFVFIDEESCIGCMVGTTCWDLVAILWLCLLTLPSCPLPAMYQYGPKFLSHVGKRSS